MKQHPAGAVNHHVEPFPSKCRRCGPETDRRFWMTSPLDRHRFSTNQQSTGANRSPPSASSGWLAALPPWDSGRATASVWVNGNARLFHYCTEPGNGTPGEEIPASPTIPRELPAAIPDEVEPHVRAGAHAAAGPPRIRIPGASGKPATGTPPPWPPKRNASSRAHPRSPTRRYWQVRSAGFPLLRQTQ